jgi:hypothetical protein
MSQSGSLGVPNTHPSIATQYTEDTGIAVPVANNLNIFSDEILPSIADSIHPGITTLGSGSTVMIALVNRTSGSGSTTDATVTNVGTTFFSIGPLIGTWAITAQISAYAPATKLGASFQLYSCGLYDGTTGRIVGTPTVLSNVDPLLSGIYVNLAVVSADSFQVQCFGIMGQDIDWTGVINFTYVE